MLIECTFVYQKSIMSQMGLSPMQTWSRMLLVILKRGSARPVPVGDIGNLYSLLKGEVFDGGELESDTD